MRLPKIMIWAIYGQSCTGKSVIAKHIGEILGVSVRHCGQLAKELAISKRLASPMQLDSNDHLLLDADTKQIASTATSFLLIEGTFLNHVLRHVEGVSFIELTCVDTERELRLQQRDTVIEKTILKRDTDDSSLANLLYHDTVYIPPLRLVVNTFGTDPRILAEGIVAILRA